MVCSICLHKSEFEISIFSEESFEHNIAEAIKKHFWFTPTQGNMICLDCWKILRDFNELYERVEQAHKLLNQQHSQGMCVEESTESTQHVSENTEIKIKSEFTFDAIQFEEFDYKEYIPEHNDERNILQCPDSKNKSSTAQTIKGRINEDDNDITSTEENINSQSELNVLRKREEKPRQSPTITNKASKHERIENAEVKQRKRWTNAESEAIIRKHLNLNCDICSLPTLSFGELQKHFQSTHPGTKAYIKCCERHFNSKQRVAQHAYVHEDPNYFKCNICDKNFASSYSLRSHKTVYHAIEDELVFLCDQCDKRFPRQHLLDYHKATHVPVDERKHKCSHCQKNFASLHLLKAHTNMRHKHATVCHICAKTISDKQAFKEHVRLHSEESGPRLKCFYPGCDKYLKNAENLKVHYRRHKQQENLSLSCDQCGKIFKTYMSLRSHKNYSHATEEFRCNLCSKKFKRKITLKEHMAYHLGEPLYKCPFCERKFNSNANMHSHKKKQHPIEWDIWRKTKTTSAQSTIY